MEAWEGLLFTPVSPAVLSLLRVALGLVLVADAVTTWREAPVTLYPDGVYDSDTARRSPAGRRLNLLSWLPPTVGSVRLVLGVYLVASVAVLVDALTPLACVVAWVALTSIHHRNPGVLNSADSVARLLLFWLIFAPAGRLWSVDAVLFDHDPDALVDAWPLRLLQFQVMVIYLRTGWWKLRGKDWRDGSAVYYSLTPPDLQRHRVPRVLHRPAFYRALTWWTAGFEVGFPLLVWIGPLRYPLLAAAAAFHLGLEWFMRIRMFQWVMLVALIVFLPPDDVARWLT